MTQPSLLTEIERIEKPRKRVRATSVAAYQVGREQFKGRKAAVLRWLAAHWNQGQRSPTSAELSVYARREYVDSTWTLDDTALLLYVWRGLSDLKGAGVVECVPEGSRICRVTGQTCETWRVKSR